MGLGMLALGILVIALVFGMLYIAFQAQDEKNAVQTAQGDSIIVVEQLTEQP